MTSFRACAAALALFVSPEALAQEDTPETTLLVDARILDVRTGETSRGAVAVTDGLIAYVGPRQGAPDGDTVIDLDGATLLPGLTDSHVHLIGRASFYGYQSLSESTPRAAIMGVANAETTLKAGFTTVRNVGAPGYADVALRDAIADGDVPGPRMLVSGPSIGITGGHCDSNLLPFEYADTSEGVADGPWAVRAKVRQNVKYGADVIKFCATGGVLSKGTVIGAQQFTLEEMSALVDEAHLLGLRVAAHAHGTDGIRTALQAGVDSVEHASLIDDESIQMAIDQGTYLSMDVYVSDFILYEGEAAGVLPESLEKERQVGQAQRERFQAAVEAGAKIAFGSDAGVYTHGVNGRQFALMTQWGMTPLQAIQAATIGNADLFGLSDAIGAIEVGKAADLIAVEGDPLDNVRELEDVDFVMKDGWVYVDEISG
ncbi:MAG: amidohydrolase family protein [Pseudomonadota bacterium]